VHDFSCFPWPSYFRQPVATKIQPWSWRITTRRARRIRLPTRRRPIYLPLQTTQARPLPATSKALRPHPAINRGRRPTKTTALISRPTKLRMIRVTESSRNTQHPSRLRLCSTTTSRTIPATTTSGRPATGPGLRTAITGYPAPGLRLLTRARSGRPATGATGITPTGFTPATGASTSATMAASTTDLATPATATRAATGAVDTSTTTARSTTSTCLWFTTSITARSPGMRTIPA
jgi:hypothetical protein